MTVISNNQGNLKGSARYYPFGGRRVDPTHEITDSGYTGHKHNDDLGLIYMVARYYDPVLRRFISADTIIPDMLDTGAYNHFAYGYNNPVKYFDPSGHIACEAMPMECQDGDWTIGNWALDLVANAFPFIYVNYLADYVAPGVIDLDTAYQISLEDTTSFVNGFMGDGGMATGARVMAGNLQGGGRALPSDFLNNDVSYIIGASYLVSAEGMAQLADLNVRELVRVRTAPRPSNSSNYGANNAINGIRLNRSLASQQQMGETGIPFAGVPGTPPFRDAPRVANTYGGQSSDWAKMTSSTYTGVDGFRFETHWVQNMQTGLRVEFKTKLLGWKAQ